MSDKYDKQGLKEALRELLVKDSASSQEEICQELKKIGYETNQSQISRMLRKIGAVKIKNERGKVGYWLPKEPPPPAPSNSVQSLVIDVVNNETTVIVHTTPGAAPVIGRVLDYWGGDLGVLGSIAGDDTIFIAPKQIDRANQIAEKIKKLFDL